MDDTRPAPDVADIIDHDRFEAGRRQTRVCVLALLRASTRPMRIDEMLAAQWLGPLNNGEVGNAIEALIDSGEIRFDGRGWVPADAGAPP